MNSDGYVLAGLAALIVGLLALLIVSSNEKQKEWETFKVAHACRIVAHIDGSVFNTFGTDSKGAVTVGVGSTSAKTGWLCNDGVTYFK